MKRENLNSALEYFIISKIEHCSIKQNYPYMVQLPAKCNINDIEIIHYGSEWATCIGNEKPHISNEYCGFYENYSGILTFIISSLIIASLSSCALPFYILAGSSIITSYFIATTLSDSLNAISVNFIKSSTPYKFLQTIDDNQYLVQKPGICVAGDNFKIIIGTNWILCEHNDFNLSIN